MFFAKKNIKYKHAEWSYTALSLKYIYVCLCVCACACVRACVGGNYITVVWQKNKSQTEAAFFFKKMQMNHTLHANKAEFIDTQIWQSELPVVAEKHYCFFCSGTTSSLVAPNISIS